MRTHKSSMLKRWASTQRRADALPSPTRNANCFGNRTVSGTLLRNYLTRHVRTRSTNRLLQLRSEPQQSDNTLLHLVREFSQHWVPVRCALLSLVERQNTHDSRQRHPATEMGEAGGVYVLDEPTTGVHLADLRQLLGLLDRLVDSGKSVIVIEHRHAVMAHADWIINLGPGAGHDGGRIVFEGAPVELVAARFTLTGEHLAAFVSGRREAISAS